MLSWLVSAVEAGQWTTTSLLITAIASLSGALVFLYRENRALHKAWRDDIQATKKEMIDLNKQTTEAVRTLGELFERISEQRGRR